MDINLPNNQDKLFKDETNFKNGAWLQNTASKYFLYSEGYRTAGEILFRNCKENPSLSNILVYPLIFNYRQFVELKLKEIITLGYKFLGEVNDFEDVHNLETLWSVYRYEILSKIENIERTILNNVGRIIRQFNFEDPKSMNFRYPFSTKPNRIQSLTRHTIDLHNFKTVIDKLNYFLDWQWDMLTHYQELQDEMNNAWRYY